MTDIVKRLRKWASEQGEDFWAQSDAELMHAAAAEIDWLRKERDRLREQVRDMAMQSEADLLNREMLMEERDRLREALLAWLDADDAGDGQECINAIAHARSVVGEDRT